MAELRSHGLGRRQGRRWKFEDCVLDEDNWSLSIAGSRVAIEAKPLELLHDLLLRAGHVVSKTELLDSIWPDVTVVEASLPTAVHKLRSALGDHHRDRSIIETVSGIGYRIAVPVEVESIAAAPVVAASTSLAGKDDAFAPGPSPAAARKIIVAKPLYLSGGLAVAFVAIAVAISFSQGASTASVSPAYAQRQLFTALRKMDVGEIEKMLAAGWDPNTPLDDQGNTAVNFVLNRCEWDPGHDQEQMVLAVRTLLDGGAKLETRNSWGDTAYSIAKAPRYCGPNHPVTKMLKALCYNGYKAIGDRCLATYELARRSRRSVGGERTAAG